LIHSNGMKTHLLSRLCSRGKPVVWHLHDYVGSRPVMARALRWASRRASAAIAVSHSVRSDAQSVLKRLPITVIHNVVDLSEFCPGPADVRRLDELAGHRRSAIGDRPSAESREPAAESRFADRRWPIADIRI